MNRFTIFLDRLNRNHRPPEAQSPVRASAVAALVSFIFICWLDGGLVSSLRIWWAELLLYAFIPTLLAFIILYRSSWHQETAAFGRTLLAALWACIISGGAMVGFAIAVVLFLLVYLRFVDNFTAFHY